ncbi:unnamed protein product, partial [Closterium sp. NIES-54]
PPSDKSVEPSGPYPELVGCLMYLMTCTRPDLAYPLNLLARYVAPGRHRKVHWDAAKRVLRYLCSTSGLGLVLGGRARVVLAGHADASWVDDLATQRSSQGYTFILGSGSVFWRSTRSSSVLSSSCEAEIYTGAMAAQELRCLTYLLTGLGEAPRSPPVLYVDNKAMLALCQEHRLEHRTKHIALCYFLARELQQRGQLRLAYVASQANTADDFTKALQPCDHQCFYTVLGLVVFTVLFAFLHITLHVNWPYGPLLVLRLCPSPYSGPSRGLTERRELESRPASPESRPASPDSRPESPVSAVRTGRRVPRQRPPPVPGSHSMTLRPSTAPQRVPLPSPPASSLPALADPESDSLRTASPIVTRLLTPVVTALPLSPLLRVSVLLARTSVGGECFAAAVPHLVSMLLAPEGDPDAPDIPTPRFYVEAIEGPYSSQWQAAMDAEMLSWKCTGTYVDEVPPPGANIVLQRFGFMYSSPQSTPLPTGHSLSPPPLDESVEPSGLYPELVGCLMYLMTCTRPDLAYPLSLLARYVAPGRHRNVHWDAAKRVLRYLCSTSSMGLVLGGRARVVLTGHADASWSLGYTFSLGSGSVSWRSTRSSSVLSSSCEAKIYAGAMAAQELRWLTYLLTDLGEVPRSPPVLYVDNKAMLALCQEHRLEHRTKHIALHYFLARDLQQRGQLRLAYVASRANTADVFTKVLQPCDHQRLCAVLCLVPTVPHLLTS